MNRSENINPPETPMKQLQIPPLSEGETYVGAIGDKNGDMHHIILLPGDNDCSSWKVQMEWAKSIGGDLPTRVEQAILCTWHRDQFKNDLYWSNETRHESDQHSAYWIGETFIDPDGDDDAWAWGQAFHYGDQGNYPKTSWLRARAVRRIPIAKCGLVFGSDAAKTALEEKLKHELGFIRFAREGDK